MKDRSIVIVSLLSTSILVSATASALADTPRGETPGVRDNRMPAIDGGLEIAIALSSAQTVGDIGGGMDANNMIGSAAQLDLAIGHRVTPHLAIGFYSSAQALAEGNAGGHDVYTAAAGVEADFHFRPSSAIDPWISIGTGVRAYMVDDAGPTLGVGAELARLQLGADFRMTEDFAFGPVLGASASLYGAQKLPMQEFEELSGKGINWTLTAGIAGRFTAFGTRN